MPLFSTCNPWIHTETETLSKTVNGGTNENQGKSPGLLFSPHLCSHWFHRCQSEYEFYGVLRNWLWFKNLWLLSYLASYKNTFTSSFKENWYGWRNGEGWPTGIAGEWLTRFKSISQNTQDSQGLNEDLEPHLFPKKLRLEGEKRGHKLNGTLLE